MSKKTTLFGTKQAIVAETPLWAKNMFRITLLLTSVAGFLIVSDESIVATNPTRILLYLRCVDLFVFGLSKMFGVQIENNEP